MDGPLWPPDSLSSTALSLPCPQRKLPPAQQQELATAKAALRRAHSGGCSTQPSSPASPVSESESDRGGCSSSDGGSSSSGRSSPASPLSPLSPRIGVAYAVAGLIN